MSLFDTVCKTNIDLANRLKVVATEYKTLYVMGCFGAPMTQKNKDRYCKNHSYNEQAARTAMIKSATEDTFGFDCVCLIKGILWGWKGDVNATYGGAVYQSNGVPDINESMMIRECKDVTTDFSSIQVGEAVWMEGHIGVYVGGGLAVECTPKWDNKVQLTACNQNVSGYNRRNWTKHGKLPYIEYIKEEEMAVTNFEKLDVVKIREGVTTYANGKTMANWVPTAKLYVREVGTEQIVVSTLKEGAITGTVWAKDLVLVEKADGTPVYPTYEKGKKVKLAPSFVTTEFDCNGNGCCSATPIDPKLVEYLQDIHDHFNATTNVTSGYRCETYNKKIGGATKSRHMAGRAADIKVTGVSPKLVAQYAEQIGIKGIGLYDTDADGHFVHVDTRESKSFWLGHAQVKVDTFQEPKKEPVTGTSSTGSEEDQKIMWSFLLNKLENEYAVAGIMGNLYAECALKSNNLQQTYEKKLGYTDDTYTAAVDNGAYTNFVKDSAGYGLAQWTYWSRKEMLLKYATENKKSIGDFTMQLNFLWYELDRNFKSLVKKLKVCTSVREASDLMLHTYEAPADQSEAVEIKRAEYGQKYYDKFHVVIPEPKEEVTPEPKPEPTPEIVTPEPEVVKPEIITPEEKSTLMKLIEAVVDFIIGLFRKSR